MIEHMINEAFDLMILNETGWGKNYLTEHKVIITHHLYIYFMKNYKKIETPVIKMETYAGYDIKLHKFIISLSSIFEDNKQFDISLDISPNMMERMIKNWLDIYDPKSRSQIATKKSI